MVHKSQSMVVLVLKYFHNTKTPLTYLAAKLIEKSIYLHLCKTSPNYTLLSMSVRKNSPEHFKLEYSHISISKSTSLTSKIFGLF